MADNEVLAIFRADVSQYEKSLNSLKEGLDSTGKQQAEFSDKGEEGQKKVAKATGDTTKATQELGKVGSTVFASLDRLTLGAASSIRNMVVALASATKGMKLLKAALVSTGIGALIVALGSLISYFTQTQRGMDAVSRVGKALGATFDVIRDRLSAFGETLIEAFKNPEKAIKDFAKVLKTFVMNRVEDTIKGFTGLGTVVKKIFERDFEGALEAGKQAAADLFTGMTLVGGVIKDNADALREMGDEISKEAAAAYDLEQAWQNLEDRKIELIKINERLKAQSNQARLDAEDENKSNAERAASLEKAIAAEKALAANQMEVARETARIIRERVALGESSREDIREQAEAEAELIRVESQLARSLRTIVTRLNAFREAVPERDTFGPMEKMAVKTLEKVSELELDNEASRKQREEDFSKFLNKQSKERVETANKEWKEKKAIIDEEDAYKKDLEQYRTDQALAGLQAIGDAAVAAGDIRISQIEKELEFATGAQKQALERQLENEKKKVANVKKAQTALLFIQEASALGRAYSELGPIAGTIAAVALVAKFAVLFKQIKAQSFAEGTDFLKRPSGVPRGKDTIPIWADEGEAIIQADKNRQYSDLVKSIRRGTVDKFIRQNYVLPELQKSILLNAGVSGAITANLKDGNIIRATKDLRRSQDRNTQRMIRAIEGSRFSKNKVA